MLQRFVDTLQVNRDIVVFKELLRAFHGVRNGRRVRNLDAERAVLVNHLAGAGVRNHEVAGKGRHLRNVHVDRVRIVHPADDDAGRSRFTRGNRFRVFHNALYGPVVEKQPALGHRDRIGGVVCDREVDNQFVVCRKVNAGDAGGDLVARKQLLIHAGIDEYGFRRRRGRRFGGGFRRRRGGSGRFDGGRGGFLRGRGHFCAGGQAQRKQRGKGKGKNAFQERHLL
ncbi:hypothetical protein SDC9_145476 [bioreactor metagenome]|uniref:Uncharacterized protein n=1 Tax=bioreactor metagenome TaxID=1076179 RepID=A0A645EA49_9ZZZZ